MDQTMLRILGFERATCGCIFARYQYVAGGRELIYVEAAATGCGRHSGSEPFEDAAVETSQPPVILYACASA